MSYDRETLDKMRSKLKTERASWDSQWQELGENISPRRARFTTSQANKGDKRHNKVIDSTATLALRTMSAGMMSGITSPARPWFKLTTPNPEMRDYQPVKVWLDDVETRMREVLIKSNIYNVLPSVYADLGLFGVSAFALLEDERDVVRGYHFPVGSYYLANNARLVVDMALREFRMTVRQLVGEFGLKVCSSRVRSLWEQNQREEWVDVVHAIYPNDEHEDGKIGLKGKRFVSCYYEVGQTENKVLREGGFDEFPILAPRWTTIGEDVYGSSPAMDALGDVKALHLLQIRKAQAIEKQINPPLVAPTSLQGRTVSMLPGGITWQDVNDPKVGVRPLYEVRFEVGGVLEDIRAHQQRISRAFFEDLFLMLANSDRRQITAREVDERHEEKLLQLGPVLERLNDELLDPLIDRVFNVMLRRGMIPPAPPELEGMELKVEYISIMAQAQKLIGIAGVDRLLGFAGNLAAVNPEVVDKVNMDEAIDVYAEMLGTSPRIIRGDDEVEGIRQARAQAAQKQAAMEQIASGAQAAKVLSETDTSRPSALTNIAGALAGAQGMTQ